MFKVDVDIDNTIKILDSDLLSLKNKISDNYDSMFFSNIYDYIDNPYINSFDDFKEFVKFIGKRLSDDGMIQCYYNWYSF